VLSSARCFSARCLSARFFSATVNSNQISCFLSARCFSARSFHDRCFSDTVNSHQISCFFSARCFSARCFSACCVILLFKYRPIIIIYRVHKITILNLSRRYRILVTVAALEEGWGGRPPPLTAVLLNMAPLCTTW